MRLKRLISTVLTTAILMTNIVYAADVTVSNSGDSGESSVELTVTGPDIHYLFSATIPAVIPANVSTDGTITVPNNIEIKNNSDQQAIKVTNITVTPSADWSLANIDSVDTLAPGKQIGLKLRNDVLDYSSGTVTLTDNNWNIGKSDSLPVTLDLKVSKQETVGKLGAVATIGFTLDWSDVEGTSGKDEPTPEKDYYTIFYTAGEHGKVVGNTSIDIKKADLADGVRIQYPETEADAGYVFDRWVIKGADGSKSEIGDTIYMSGDITLEAQFMQRQAQTVYLTFRAGEHGSVKDDAGKAKMQFTRTLSVSGGSFQVTFPELIPDSGYEIDHWINTADNSLAFNPYDGSGNMLNDGKNGFDFTAVYREKQTVYVSGTFHAGSDGYIIDEDNGNALVSILTTKFAVGDDGRFSVKFPKSQGKTGKVGDYWINTKSGTKVDTAGIEVTNNTVEFTLIYKDAPSTRVKVSTDGSAGGSLANTNDIVIGPTQTTSPLPTVSTNSGWTFLGWYYKQTGEKLPDKGSDTVEIAYNDLRGWVDKTANELVIPIEARFAQAKTLSMDESSEGTTNFEYNLDLTENTESQVNEFTGVAEIN